MERFYLKFVEDDARDVGFQYLDTICKKVKTKVEDHINRYSTLYGITIVYLEWHLNATKTKRRFTYLALSHRNGSRLSSQVATLWLLQH